MNETSNDVAESEPWENGRKEEWKGKMVVMINPGEEEWKYHNHHWSNTWVLMGLLV